MAIDQPHHCSAPRSPATAIRRPGLERGPSAAWRTGRPLDESVRDTMGQRLGHDFSHVRVHDDETAATSARAVDAEAFTVGHHLVFGRSRYAPGTAAGDRLITHELIHVVQQAGDPAGSGPDVVPHDAASELDAMEVACRRPPGPSSGGPTGRCSEARSRTLSRRHGRRPRHQCPALTAHAPGHSRGGGPRPGRGITRI